MAMILTSTNMQEIQITNLSKNPGILPFKLGSARINSKSHTFIHYYDLEPVRNEIDKIKEEYRNVTKLIQKKLTNPQMIELENFDKALWFQLNAVEQKFNSIMPNIRIKRGLIDGLGSIIKSITGNLDANDALHYDQAIKDLQINENEIVQKLNKEISITTQIIDNFNVTITGIQYNQHVIASNIDKLNNRLQNIVYNFTDYLQIRNVVDQLNLTLSLMLQLLIDIENSITFARLNIYHSSILKINELETILNFVLKYYSINELMFPNLPEHLHLYYNILDIEAYYSGSRVVFIIHFPIVHPDSFNYYHLYSLPTENNTIIIPPNTYLIMNEKTYQYAPTACVKLHTDYYCPDNYLLEGSNTKDCLFNLLQLSTIPADCIHTPVEIENFIIEQVNQADYIGIFPRPTKIRTICSRSDFTTLKGTYLIKLPSGCRFETNETKFFNNNEVIDGTPMFLPEVAISPGVTTEKTTKIKLRNINLDKVHEVEIEQRKINYIDLQTNQQRISNYLISYSPISIIIVVITCYIIYKIVNYRRGLQKNPVQTEELQNQQPQAQPRIFFNP